ncbi:helix-turn-helix domain-containing protein [Paenibacillus sp. 1P03SA]|uniref:helix-turn-helix domain-containing protein n=1 Tax=Paenibacillus sp. 1P03SA TaxID=3132294 RepID=UPI0039A2B8BB
MSNIHEFLTELRKNRGLTLREVSKKSGLSHSYISSLEKGVHPRTKAPINPSPDSLKRLAAAYNFPYKELMDAAGYWDAKESTDSIKIEKESEYSLSENKINHIIRDVEEEYKVNLSDDPVVQETIRTIIESLAKKMSQDKK